MWRCTINRKTSPLNSPYTEITDEWLRETPTKTNLKNALVADIDADGIIYKSIMEYVQLLNEKSADITLSLASVCSCKVTARVKAQNSIEFKIQNYKTERHEFGKIPINKCINDLFGVRIFLREPLTFDEVYSFIEDRVLSGLDVANYILSKIRCTHLSLEKLVYYAYADYLCEHSERLFEDHIYAFRHGPVINSVYETFKRSGSQYVKPFEFGDDSDIRTGVKELPARSRILFAKEGTEKLSSIDRTIAKYGKYSAGALVDLTHRAGTPWSYVDSSVAYQEISDNLIMAYHHVESV